MPKRFMQQRKDVAVFRIIPNGPVVDYWTPSKTEQGKVYVLSLIGVNLQHAQLIAADPSRFRIYSLDNSEDNRITAVLKVLPNAPPGETALIVRDSNNREGRVSITVLSPVTVRTTSTTGPRELSVKNVTAGMQDMAPLYVQEFQTHQSTSKAFGPRIAGNYTHNLAHFSWQIPLIYCPSLGEYGDYCVKDLYPGQSVDIEGFILSIFLKADL